MKSVKFTVFLIVIAIMSGFFGGMLTNSVALPFLVQYQSSDTNNKSSDVSVIQPVKLKVVDEESDVISAIEKISPAVVSVIVTKDLQVIKTNPFMFDDPFFFIDPFAEDPLKVLEERGAEIKTEKANVGGGTGFIFTEDGLIITNKHVVEDEDADYTVILNNGDEYPAEVVDKDVYNDIAVVRLLPDENGNKPSNLPVVTFGDSKKIKVGQKVIAVGNALSEFSNTVTVGVISAKERSIVASDTYGRGESLTGLIQTDAAINPGNSGGPLVNLAGEVIGVNTAIAYGANGVGFALPINDVTTIIESVKETGRIIRPVLGVRYIQLDKTIAEEYDIEGVTEGALLIGNALNKEFAVIPGKPAAKAGLKENDILIEINGRKITKDSTLRDIVSSYGIDETIDVVYIRDGQRKEAQVKLEEAEE